MAKYLIKISYNAESTEGLSKEHISDCRKIVEELISRMGGKLESFYYAFGDHGVFCVSDIPDDLTATGLAASLNESGLVSCSTTLLISAEDIDKGKNKKVHHSLSA